MSRVHGAIFWLILTGSIALTSVSSLRGESLEDILVPLGGNSAPVPGAYGSRWVVEEYHRNTGDRPVSLTYLSCLLPGCQPLMVEPGRTLRLPGDAFGLYRLSGEQLDRYEITIVARDVSRQSSSWGSQVPAVWVRDMVSDRFDLIRVPTDVSYRRHLRLYAVWRGEESGPSILRVRIYDADADLRAMEKLLGEREFVVSERLGHIRTLVGQVSIGNLDEIYDRASTGAVRIQVEQVSGVAKIWGFVTLTNNDTQHFTAIVP